MNEDSFKINCQYSSIIQNILDVIQEIALHLRQTPIVQLSSFNKFGDQQLHQDVFTDELVQRKLQQNKDVFAFASEQRPQLIEFPAREKKGYFVTYDPLDGSSIVDTNFAVGSIFSIWPYNGNKLIGSKVKEQVNAVLAIYGPRTTAIFWNPEVNKVQELTLIKSRTWIVSHRGIQIKPDTKMFSPGNLRATSDHKQYEKMVFNWMQRAFTLRYTGGMVPDLSQILIKQHGIFCNVASKNHKAKLRVLYQVAAAAFLIQKAGGKTVTIGGGSVLDYEIKTMDDRLPYGAGSANEVDRIKHLF